MGGPVWAAHNMARIAWAESRDIPSAVQTGMPPGLTGYGLYQITPTSGIRQNGQFGNLLNAYNNTRAAISLFNRSGYGPWASDPVGRSLTHFAMFGNGGAITEPIAGVGLRSGQAYSFGEAGHEQVSSQADLKTVATLLAAVLAELRALNKQTAMSPARTGAAVGASLNHAAGAAALAVNR